jgi:multicomponent Na+:H+ antiporter subunit G
VLSWLLLLSGSVFVLIGGIGLLRMPSLYARLHAASLTDTLGTLLILGGIIIQAGFTLAAIKLVAIAVFLLLTGPTAAYALANAALLSGSMPSVREVDDP